ncbi:unnamed protein product [Rotaria sp. Silwood1]|nr:unnamed protein product [Rotaria sp. Silwood1]
MFAKLFFPSLYLVPDRRGSFTAIYSETSSPKSRSSSKGQQDLYSSQDTPNMKNLPSSRTLTSSLTKGSIVRRIHLLN